jgi:dTDP-glucose 4,6-dehydratase
LIEQEQKFNDAGFTDAWFLKEHGMERIMVTGGCGFMGSHFAKLLVEKYPDAQVFIVDKMTYAGSWSNVCDIVEPKGKARIFIRDIADNNVGQIMNYYGIDTVVNFAAETHVDRSIKDPQAFLQTDIMGLFNLVHAALQCHVKHFIHISTDEVYGPVFVHPGVDESAPLNPSSPYSASKAAADLLLQSYRKTYGLPLSIVRPCNNYGPNQYPEKLIPMAITRLLQGKKVYIHGEGLEIREWIYVGDCVRGILKVLEMDKGDGSIYNLGSANRIRNIDVITMICSQMGLVLNCNAEHVPNRPGNDECYAIDSRRAVNELNWFPLVNFQDGLGKTIQWYQEHAQWWENVNLDANLYREGKYLR